MAPSSDPDNIIVFRKNAAVMHARASEFELVKVLMNHDIYSVCSKLYYKNILCNKAIVERRGVIRKI